MADSLAAICHVDFSSTQHGAGPSNPQRDNRYDELERYLAGEGGPGELDDPLRWWKVRYIYSSSLGMLTNSPVPYRLTPARSR